MKKAALSTSQSFQHRASAPRAFALTPSVDKALTSAASSSTTLVRSTVAVSAPAPSAISPKPEPPQLNWPRKQVSPPMTADPEKDPDAIRLEKLSFQEAILKGLRVMDMTAFALCQENNMPVIVFDINEPENLKRIIEGERVGTLAEKMEK